MERAIRILLGAWVGLALSACTAAPELDDAAGGPLQLPTDNSEAARAIEEEGRSLSALTGKTFLYCKQGCWQDGLSFWNGSEAVDGSSEDCATALRYPRVGNKGQISPDGQRITILTAKARYMPLEPIHIIHVHETTLPGVYTGGFVKRIKGETVDGVPLEPKPSQPTGWEGDGEVTNKPAIDYGYYVTELRLPAGTHNIHWNLPSGGTVLSSNTITVTVE